MIKDVMNHWGEIKKALLESIRKENPQRQKENEPIYDVLFENMKQSLLESAVFTTMDQTPVIRVLLGIQRRMLPKLLTPIISVQPLKAPVGLVKIKKIILETPSGTRYDLMNYQQLPTPDYLPQEDVSAPKATVATVEVDQTNEVEVVLGTSGKILPNTVTISYTLGGREYVLSDNTIIQNEHLFQTINYETRTVTITPKGTQLGTVTVSAIIGTSWEENVNLPQMKFEIVNLPINTITRKLRASWTYEQMEDFSQELSGLANFEEEVYNDAQQYIAQEINREILDDLIGCAQSSASWVRMDPSQSDYLTQEQYFRTLLYKINAVAQEITRKTQLIPNFIVVSPLNWSVLEDGLTQYVFKRSEQAYEQNIGFAMVGEINSRYKVYVTSSMPDSAVLVGYKGTNIDQGYIYAPYVPLKAVPYTMSTVPSLLFYTRYGKKVVMPQFYGKVVITQQ